LNINDEQHVVRPLSFSDNSFHAAILSLREFFPALT
jgi:hypothetical protein